MPLRGPPIAYRRPGMAGGALPVPRSGAPAPAPRSARGRAPAPWSGDLTPASPPRQEPRACAMVRQPPPRRPARARAPRLRLGRDVGQVLAAREAAPERRLRADVRGQPDRLAHVGRGGQEQEAARRERRQVLQRRRAREQQRRGEAEALRRARASPPLSAEPLSSVWSRAELDIQCSEPHHAMFQRRAGAARLTAGAALHACNRLPRHKQHALWRGA